MTPFQYKKTSCKDISQIPQGIYFVEKNLHLSTTSVGSFLERTTGVEPACSAWEADILPMNYVRKKMPPNQRRRLVEISGIEPLTSWMPFKRSPSWAIPPSVIMLPHYRINFKMFFKKISQKQQFYLDILKKSVIIFLLPKFWGIV